MSNLTRSAKISSAAAWTTDGWIVTHIRSGKSIALVMGTRLQAFAFARGLLGLGEWDRPAAVILRTMPRKVKRLRRAMGL